ncbi:MAG TPA: hypothetical protein VFP60_16020 [Pseudolabrys sp.]|nr:hypothetical protein [Pseudolabrys sp.]
MKAKFVLPLVSCALATALLTSSASAADPQNPYIHRETSGSWTNVEFNDGICHYYYSFNAYDQNTKLNRYGDCSHIVIGPNGQPMRRIAEAPVVVPMR